MDKHLGHEDLQIRSRVYRQRLGTVELHTCDSGCIETVGPDQNLPIFRHVTAL